MRIALLSPPSLAVGPHGGPRPAPLVSTLADGLVARGHDVTLFATGDSTTSAALVSVCPRASADCQDLTPDQWELLLATEVFARSREFDLLHSHAGASALVGASLQEIPVLATIHRVASPAERTLFARMGRRIAFAANSEGERLPELEEDRRVVSWVAFDSALLEMLLQGRCPRCGESFTVTLGGGNRCWSCGGGFTAWILEQPSRERRER